MEGGWKNIRRVGEGGGGGGRGRGRRTGEPNQNTQKNDIVRFENRTGTRRTGGGEGEEIRGDVICTHIHAMHVSLWFKIRNTR